VSESDLPPPPPLAAPAGYVGYTPTNWAAGLRRVGGLAKALLIVLVIVAIGQVLSVATTGTVRDAAREYLASDRSDAADDAFQDDLAVNGLTSLLAGAASIAVIVLSMIWLYRVAANHRSLGRQLTWAPGWAIGGWFLPPLLFIIPLLMLRESWKASAPDVPPGSPEWKQKGESPLIWTWFLVYSVVPIVLAILGASQFRNFSRDTEDLAEYFDEQQGLIIASGLVTVLAAIAWGLVVREITSRHARLSGEAAIR
jgi:Domain of unknown function (DUF4328)